MELAASDQDIWLVMDTMHDSDVLALASGFHVAGAGAPVLLIPPNEKFQNEVTIVAYALGDANRQPIR